MSQNGTYLRETAETNQLEISLRRLELMLQRQILRLRVRHQLVEHDFRGTFISDREVDALMAAVGGGGDEPPSIQAISAQLDLLTASEQFVEEHPIHSLGQRLGLNEIEQDILLIALAPALDSRFELFYAYVQNDMARKLPGVDLVLKLLFEGFEARLAGQCFFNENGPLRRYKVIHLEKQARQLNAPLLSHHLNVDQAVVAHLLGQGEVDPCLKPWVILSRCPIQNKPLPFSEELLAQVDRTGALIGQEAGVICLGGLAGVGKRQIARRIAAQLERPLLEVEWEKLKQGVQDEADLLARLLRDAYLFGAVVYFEGGRAEMPDLSRFDVPVIWGHNDKRPLITEKSFFNIHLPAPDYEQRLGLWEHFLGLQRGAEDVSAVRLANQFSFNLAEVERTVQYAVNQGRVEGEEGLTNGRLLEAARHCSNKAIGDLAQKIETHLGWDDIFLPRACLRQLQEVYRAIKHRHTVYSQWGFGQKLTTGKGISALFFGPSGTGKTMAVSILANEIGLDLYKIDLATVVSKYIGETEQNLRKIFMAAESSNAILFFDEADALFGKRSEVRDARDRYANLEVAFLLQQIEAYTGIVILATNLSNNMDDAFARRLHHTVEFRQPTAGIREALWRQSFPEAAPVETAIDFEFLARQFDISGGNIRNIALSAAFMAAEAGVPVQMEMIILGLARELQKMGKLPNPNTFGSYYTLLQADLQVG